MENRRALYINAEDDKHLHIVKRNASDIHTEGLCGVLEQPQVIEKGTGHVWLGVPTSLDAYWFQVSNSKNFN